MASTVHAGGYGAYAMESTAAYYEAPAPAAAPAYEQAPASAGGGGVSSNRYASGSNQNAGA